MLKENLNNQPSVTPVYDAHELEAAKFRTAEIRFECLVKMFDFGQRRTSPGFFKTEGKPLPPQWFKSQMKLTLESVKYMDPHTLGTAIKQMFFQLEQHIKQYEERGL